MAESPGNSLTARRVIGIVQVVFTLGAFCALALLYDTRTILQSIARLSISSWSFLLTLSAAQVVLLVIRWRCVIRALGFDMSLELLTIGTLSERFVNQILPSTLGGDAARIGHLVAAKVNPKGAALSVFFDRSAGILALVILAGVSAPLIADVLVAANVAWPIGITVAASFAGVAALAALPVNRVATAIRATPVWFIGALIERTHQLFRRRQFVVDALAISIAIQAAFVVVFVVIGAAIVPSVSWLTLGAFASVLLLASLIPVSIAGWGVREGAALLLFASIGVRVEDAIAISVVFGIVQFASGMLCGIGAGALSLFWSGRAVE